MSLSILSLGYPKSGNVWLNYLLRDICTAAGVEVRQAMEGHPISEALKHEHFGIRGQDQADFIVIDPLRTYFGITSVFRWPIEDIAAYAARTSLVMSHCPWRPEPSAQMTYRSFTHRILVVRDVRDVAVSWSRFMFTPFNRLHNPVSYPNAEAFLAGTLAQRVTGWSSYHEGWLVDRTAEELPVHVIFYEQLMTKPVHELRRLCTYLGLDVNEVKLEDIVRRNDLKEMKQRQPDHVFRGGWGNWREFLDDRQIHIVQRSAGEMLRLLGYPLNGAEAANWQPDQLRVPVIAAQP